MWCDDDQSRDGNKIIEGYDDNDILYIYVYIYVLIVYKLLYYLYLSIL